LKLNADVKARIPTAFPGHPMPLAAGFHFRYPAAGRRRASGHRIRPACAGWFRWS